MDEMASGLAVDVEVHVMWEQTKESLVRAIVYGQIAGSGDLGRTQWRLRLHLLHSSEDHAAVSRFAVPWLYV